MRAIALTGNGFSNDMKRSAEVGFEMHLTKPVDWSVLSRAIASLFPASSESKAKTGTFAD